MTIPGTSRTAYETILARLDNFPALESDWRELLPRIVEASDDIHYRDDDGQEGTLVSLWEDHVLTVLVEIASLETPADVTGLQDVIYKWIGRLDRFIDRSWKCGYGDTSATQAGRQLKNRLKESLSDKSDAVKRNPYQALASLRSIQEHFDYYLAQIENDGDMDGALSLLLAYLRNYGGITQTFNRRFATLPQLNLRDILHAVPQGTVQDNTYILVVPADDKPGFTLPTGQPFPAGQNAAGENLLYQTVQNEYITPLYCAGVNAVYLDRKDGKTTAIRKQAICDQDLPTAETLFSDKHSQPLPLGWMVESSMLLLGEGERNVCVSFRVTDDTARSLSPDMVFPDSFTLHISTAESWTKQPCTCRIDTTDGYFRLCFDFIVSSNGILPAPCTEETHGMTTEHPALRILADETSCPYVWASLLKFDAVKIRTVVTGIRNFTFYNELGQIDTSQPFQPFGVQAEKGAWFLFGNEEMGLKTLEEVRLKGNWTKLPETEAEFNLLYTRYAATAGQTIDTTSFAISTEWQQGGKWKLCQGGLQHLFVPDNPVKKEDRSLSHAEVVFDFSQKTLLMDSLSVPYEYSRDRDGFFRVTLQTPSIGFGTNAYRTLFTETMIHNSRCKEKKHKGLPPEPAVPLLADVELSYSASEETVLAGMVDSSIRLSPIMALSEHDNFPVNKADEQPFLPAFTADHLLYFSFLHAKGEQTVRIYLDMVLAKENLPFNSPQPDKKSQLAWELRDGNSWYPIAIDSVRAEETNGLTQSGFIEIKLPEKISDRQTDGQGRLWLRAAVTGDVSSCLAIRGVWTNCIRVAAQNGDGSALPAGTIQELPEADERIRSIVQPLSGFGGRSAETETEVAVHLTARIRNRHRAVTIKEYEQLVLEHFPEADKVQCIPVPRDKGASEICLVVFSRAEDNRYCLSPAWKLAEIQRLISRYAPPFVTLRVINPVYETVRVHCKAVLWGKVQDEGKVIRQLVVLAQNYIAPWYRRGDIPELCQHYSYKELHARMVNHEDLMKLVSLEVDGKSLPRVDIDTEDLPFKGKHPWSVLLPSIEIELLSSHVGIGAAEIGGNFIIV